MASVVLDRLWIHDAADLSSYLRFFTTGRGDERNADGEVRRYAGGRLRVIRRAGSSKQITATLRQITDADLEQLEEWQGETVMVRDHRGRLMFAVFFSLGVTDYADRSGYDVAVTFQQVTSSLPEV